MMRLNSACHMWCVAFGDVACVLCCREGVLMDTLWAEMAPHVLNIFIEAAQGQSAG